jgi:hypothetical protein
MPRSCSDFAIINNPAPKASAPETEVLNPFSLPLRVFGMVFPSTSLEAMEDNPRERLNSANRRTISQPAVAPLNDRLTTPIPAMDRNCSSEPITHTHFRIGNLRIYPAMKICGSMDPDSRIGTRKPMSATGAFT